ncbi:ATP-binding protein [Thauera aromatica]|uniref:ATP-binding protein n=1 Tax=Thauera aromatica TaxID=59405 RepID=UPI001FFC5A0D|nr:transporter substrate-binding domain-containing protein [Thauera aromatica]MCK2095580.1 transporter substrate-binding domain-containing protein [Thauera aromatica]
MEAGVLIRSGWGRAWRRVALLVLLLPTLAVADHSLRVGIYQNSPKVGLGANGKAEGIFVDVLEAIARAEGWRIEYVPGSWNEGLERLAAGEIDLMPDVAPSAERERLFDFHDEPVLSSWSQVYARPDSGIRTLLDLDGERVAVLDGSVQEAVFRQMASGFSIAVELLPVPDFFAALDAVAEGRADAVVTNRYFGMRYAPGFGLEDTAVMFSPVQLYFAMRKGSDPALLAAIDRQLVALKKDHDSAYFRSLRRWAVEAPRVVLPPWLSGAVALAVALLLAAVAWVWLLRRQVALKTDEIVRSNAEVNMLAQRHTQELEQRVAERTEALARANAELLTAKQAAESADHLKSAFLATMSHELRTPLNSIIGFTGILLQGLAGPLNAEQGKQLGMVRDSARHLLALINDVLDISRIEAGELRMACDVFDPAAAVAKVVGIVRPLAEKKALALEVEVADGIGPMVGDARRVEQILLNLLGNAVKFTEQGRVRLQVDAVAGPPGPAGAAAAPRLRMAVSDTGIGIRPEDMVLLFQPFRQVDTALSRKHDGTGLGLAICRRLAEMMGGDITVDSRWQEGSTFTVVLPLRPDGPEEEACA